MNVTATAEEDFLVFDDEPAEEAGKRSDSWNVMIVDDDPEMHSVTRLALADFTYDGRGLNFISAYSGEEGRRVYQQHKDIALILLDVVMERDDAGLQYVKFIRDQMNDHHVRIVLRTGQPGSAPEKLVVRDYDIDDYKAKTEMTVQKLYTTVVASLRGYKEIRRIETIVEERTETITHMNKELQSVNTDLIDSIQYARRIQEAILPELDAVRSLLPNFFVYYEPRDIVSGDFYWFQSRGNEMLFAAVDCTGHGVPGAFMAVLGYSILNQVITVSPDLSPNLVLVRLDRELKKALQRTARAGMGTTDGMDLALCNYNPETRVLKFAGARRPMLVFRANGDFESYDGTRVSIGGPDVIGFQLSTIQLNEGDTCFIFTDGITDQFGGERGRKLSKRRLLEFLTEHHAKPIDVMVKELGAFVQGWKGNQQQTDDILLMGVRG